VTESIPAILILVAVILYWLSAARAKETASRGARNRCQQAGVLFLDDTVALRRWRLRRDSSGAIRMHREYGFEFATDGGIRYRGKVVLSGARVLTIELEAYGWSANEESSE
jgi:hypothetical protein